uniref:Uncharacterized protein n=1 Tax=Glossina brevipalpis TaxID=37001 RepID=A0A1A9WGC2_9MUSC
MALRGLEDGEDEQERVIRERALDKGLITFAPLAVNFCRAAKAVAFKLSNISGCNCIGVCGVTGVLGGFTGLFAAVSQLNLMWTLFAVVAIAVASVAVVVVVVAAAAAAAAAAVAAVAVVVADGRAGGGWQYTKRKKRLTRFLFK